MKKLLLLLSIAGFFGLGFLAANVAVASEVEGSLGDTQIETGVSGTLIGAPTASPGAGTYTSTQSVTLTASGSQSIRYTTDGSTPTCSSTQYVSAITVSSSRNIKAISCYPDGSYSSVASFAYTISAPASSGGSGGGAPITSIPTPTPDPTPDTPAPAPQEPLMDKPIAEMTPSEKLSLIAKIQSMIASLQVQIAKMTGAPVPTEPGVPDACQGITFTRNLSVGDTGNDVRCLQATLNARGFQVAASGPGSPGNETQLFGALTRTALARFQAANNIAPAAGFFGPITRSFLGR